MDRNKDMENTSENTGERMKKTSLLGLRTFASLKNPVYRIYYGAMVGQWFAMSMQMITRSLLLYRLTASSAFIGLAAIAQAAPNVVMALFGGAIADRVQKKYILLIGQIGSALTALMIAATLSLGYLTSERWWLLLVSSALQGTVMGFMQPARMAIIPEIVGSNQVMNAISLSSMGMTVFRLIGPVMAGFLIAVLDFSIVYYLMTFMYILAVGFALRLPLTGETETRYRKSNPLADIAEGLRYLRKDTVILLILIFGTSHVICGQPFMQLMPVFTEDILKVGSTGLGIMNSVSGFGAMIGSLILASLPNRRRGMILLLSGVIMGSALIVFSWSSSWYLSLTMMPLAGLGPAIHMTMTATLIQYYVDSDYRGRMQSFVMMNSGLASLGTFLTGVLAESIGIQWSLGVMSMMLVAVSLIFITCVPKLAKLD